MSGCSQGKQTRTFSHFLFPRFRMKLFLQFEGCHSGRHSFSCHFEKTTHFLNFIDTPLECFSPFLFCILRLKENDDLDDFFLKDYRAYFHMFAFGFGVLFKAELDGRQQCSGLQFSF
eukprot:EG_transcript_18079